MRLRAHCGCADASLRGNTLAPADDGPQPSVTILKPLCWHTSLICSRVCSAFGATSTMRPPVHIVFGSQQHRSRSGARHRQSAASLRVSRACGRRCGRVRAATAPNRKVSNLINMAPPRSATRSWCCPDSDIDGSGRAYLGDVGGGVAQARGRGRDLPLSRRRGAADSGRASRRCRSTPTFCPTSWWRAASGSPNPASGRPSRCAARPSRRSAGFDAFADCLAERLRDRRGGARGRAMTWRSRRSRSAMSASSATATELLRHQMRQSRTIRNIDPVGYAGAIITHPVRACADWRAARQHIRPAGGGARRRLAAPCSPSRSNVPSGLPRQPYWLVPFRDLLAFTTFVSGFFGTTVSWRGSRYRVLSDGSVVQRSN